MVGKETIAYCGRCEAMRDHLILAEVQRVPVKARCTDCRAEHKFRAVDPRVAVRERARKQVKESASFADKAKRAAVRADRRNRRILLRKLGQVFGQVARKARADARAAERSDGKHVREIRASARNFGKAVSIVGRALAVSADVARDLATEAGQAEDVARQLIGRAERSYDSAARYAVGDVVRHPVFGSGLVRDAREAIEVAFLTDGALDVRRLAHGRRASVF